MVPVHFLSLCFELLSVVYGVVQDNYHSTSPHFGAHMDAVNTDNLTRCWFWRGGGG